MPAAEVVNEALNVVQLLFLAWLAAHYRNGSAGGRQRPHGGPDGDEGGPDRAALDYVHRADAQRRATPLER